MFEKFREWYEGRHEYAREWKEKKKGKVLGYMCTYVPEELLYAAGVLPVRLLGSHEPEDLTERHIVGMYCPFCRDVLAQGLRGRYDYLDGVMIAQSCLHLRQSFASWRRHVPVDYHYYLYMPHGVQNRRAKAYLANELATFKQSLEEWTGRTITGDDLDRGIEIVNRNRRLLRSAYEMRKFPQPPLTGLEAMYMVVSAQLTDKEEHNAELEKVLAALPARRLDRDPGIRLLMVGSENDDIEFLKMVESMNATVVADDHCTGSRYFWNDVDLNAGGDRLAAIASRYVDRVPCPSKDWPQRIRLQHVLQMARDYNVQGALTIQQKFCDPHELDMPPLINLLKENGIPSYFFEFDMTLPVGQFKVRFEAFLEMLRAEELPF